MMNRTEFTAAIAALFFAAFIIGWLAGLIVQRLRRPTHSDMEELDRMAQQLHDAEAARDTTARRSKEREAELRRKIASAEGEAMVYKESLRDCRAETEQLRDYIEKHLPGR